MADDERHFFLAPGRKDYKRFRAVMNDRDDIPRTFNEWERNIKRHLTEASAAGIVLEPVSFDADNFLAFCRDNNLPPGGRARAEFAATIGKAKSAH
jgi:hypothetical protein